MAGLGAPTTLNSPIQQSRHVPDTLLPPPPSHHIDIHNWMAGGASRPVTVTALAAAGVAESKLGRPCEDTITLSVKWENDGGTGVGTAVYTASWIAPKVRGCGRGTAGLPGRAGSCFGVKFPHQHAPSARAVGAVRPRAAPTLNHPYLTPVTPRASATRASTSITWGSPASCTPTRRTAGTTARRTTPATPRSTPCTCGGRAGVPYPRLGVRKPDDSLNAPDPPPTHTPSPPAHARRSYVPDANGRFAGQTGYGYISIAKFVSTAR